MTGALCIPYWVLWYLGGSVVFTVVCLAIFACAIRREFRRSFKL